MGRQTGTATQEAIVSRYSCERWLSGFVEKSHCQAISLRVEVAATRGVRGSGDEVFIGSARGEIGPGQWLFDFDRAWKA